MPNHATAVITGHLGGDPETKYTPNGLCICNFSLGVNTGYGDKKVTTWWRVTFFGKQGEKAAELLKQGTAATIAGEPQNRPYEKDGQKRYSLELKGYSWDFAGSKQESATVQNSVPVSVVPIDDDIPF